MLQRIATMGRERRAGAAASLAAVLVLTLSGAFGAAAAVGARATASRAVHLRVGTQTLRRCAANPLAYCGTLAVPLDYASPSGPDIRIAFRWYPASAPASSARGTVVPVEGGPGYPSTGSVLYPSGSGPAGYAPMYGPLLERWNMLAVDNRGTGASTALRCKPLQAWGAPTGTAGFQRTVGECGEALNHRWRYPGGGYCTPRTCSPRLRRRPIWRR